jgi:hypothetical protein
VREPFQGNVGENCPVFAGRIVKGYPGNLSDVQLCVFSETHCADSGFLRIPPPRFLYSRSSREILHTDFRLNSAGPGQLSPELAFDDSRTF